MRRYLILIAYEVSEWDDASEEVRQSYYRDHEAFSRYASDHGTEHGSAALADADQATTLRHAGRRRDGAVHVSDGPFAETVEQIGGYYDVELPDLDHALTAAEMLPAAYSIEIRPTITMD